MVITLGAELAAALSEQARRRRVPPEVLALEVLQRQFLRAVPADPARDQWEVRLRQVATDCGVSLPDEALSSEGLYP